MVSSQEVPGTWKLLSLARGGCIGGDIGRRDDRGRPPVSVSTEATSIYIPVGKVRRGCPGVLRVLKMDRPMGVASLLFTTLVYRHLPLGYHRTAAKFLSVSTYILESSPSRAYPSQDLFETSLFALTSLDGHCQYYRFNSSAGPRG